MNDHNLGYAHRKMENHLWGPEQRFYIRKRKLRCEPPDTELSIGEPTHPLVVDDGCEIIAFGSGENVTVFRVESPVGRPDRRREWKAAIERLVFGVSAERGDDVGDAEGECETHVAL